MRALRCEMLPFVGLTEDEAHCTIGVVTTNDIDMDGDEVDHVDRSHGTMLIVDTGSSEGTTAVHVCQPSWKLVPPRIPQRMLCFLLWPLLHTRSSGAGVDAVVAWPRSSDVGAVEPHRRVGNERCVCIRVVQRWLEP